MTTTIRAVTPSSTTLVAGCYDQPDHRDALQVEIDPGRSIADVATAFFLNQPAWIARVSMNLGSTGERRRAVTESGYRIGSSVGSWRLVDRGPNELVFGDDLGFLQYRFSLALQPPEAGATVVEASTAVVHRGRFGGIYFAIVKPFHLLFLRRALRALAAPAPIGADRHEPVPEAVR